MIDETHDVALRCWVSGSEGHQDFPIQNLPLGIFSSSDGSPRAGVAIGDMILDLPAVLAASLLLDDACRAVEAMAGGALNASLALGPQPRRALRAQLSELLRVGAPRRSETEKLLYPAAECILHLPTTIGDYTDFYVGIHHAENIGKQFRPDNPLLPNYKHVPIGYHGRASSIRASGIPVRRPNGQIKPPDADEPSFGPCRRLDYELELGVWIGPSNELGDAITVDEAPDHVAGFCLLNDWSARDIQAWEYQPLGPFLAKNFASTVSPWIITPEALAPFRMAPSSRPSGDPQPLQYLRGALDQKEGALDLELEVLLMTDGLRARGLPAQRLALSNTRHMYWTVAQMIAHHTSGGCSLRAGDLLGSGTISGPDATAYGSILEATAGGKNPIKLNSGEQRRFLEDGDEVILRAGATRAGFASIGFGECRALILPARSL